jgi:hypothetical protein
MCLFVQQGADEIQEISEMDARLIRALSSRFPRLFLLDK